MKTPAEVAAVVASLSEQTREAVAAMGRQQLATLVSRAMPGYIRIEPRDVANVLDAIGRLGGQRG